MGHFTAGNNDALAFLKQHHDRITNVHLRDRKRNNGPNRPFGQGDTPIREGAADHPPKQVAGALLHRV